MKNKITLFDILLYCFMAVVVVITLYPLWYILIASFSDATEVASGKVLLAVRGFNIEAYKRTFETEHIWSSYLNTIFYTVFGTLLSMVLTTIGSYALSKKRLRGRKGIMIFIMITMWFSAGLIPTYLTYRTLHLLDTRTGILLCGAVSSFYLIIMRTFFENIPESMEESAKLDGASDMRILISIYLPLSTASLLTIGLYYMVQRWNSYFWAMILLNDTSKVPLQVVLKKLIVTMSGLFDNADGSDITVMSAETLVYATIVIAAAPMLFVYPFIQRFFVKGVMIRAVKG